MSKSRKAHLDACLALASRNVAESREINPDGSASFPMEPTEPNIQDVQELLSAAFDFKSDVPKVMRDKIVSSALFALARETKKSAITAEKLLSLIESEQRTYRRKRKIRYFLHSQISIDSRAEMPRHVQWGDTTIVFYPGVPRLRPDEKKFSAALRSLGITKRIDGWHYLNAYVTARDEHEAAHVAYHAISLLRSLWNFQRNAVMYSRSSNPTPRPLNLIRLGPLQTIHLKTRPADTSSWWYSTPFVSFDYPGRPWKPTSSEVADIRDVEKWIKGKIRRCKYGSFIADNFVNYVAAMDHADHSDTFQQLWAVLEALTGCGRSGAMKYDELVRRAANCFFAAGVKKVILDHLRFLRNRYVHELDTQIGETSCFQLVRIIHGVFLFHLRSCTFFNDVDEAFDFLDLPMDSDLLKRSIKIRSRALRLVSESELD